MCGICGFVTERNINCETLCRMNDSMYHRGPDDYGYEIIHIGNRYYGMAHRRLSIIDLSSAGHQPMWSNDKKICVIFNGEIYNYLELRKKLGNYSYHSNSDTEVILTAYMRWGEKCFEHFNGMYAIAILDIKNQKTILARDRIGKKPLYYWVSPNHKSIVFASELKPILKFPLFNEDINLLALAQFSGLGYINSPNTIFNNTYKLYPGSFLVFENDQVKTEKYWEIQKVFCEKKERKTLNYEDAKYKLKAILKNAVSVRMNADVPLGTLLSGGYDSSLVCAVAQQLSRGSTPINTFTIGFGEKKYNEAQDASAIAEYLGTNHTDIYCGENDLIELLKDMPYYFDEPIADPSIIPTMLVSKLAKKNVSTVLSGDGGDELFCGYSYYKTIRIAQLLDKLGAILYMIGSVGNLKEKFPYHVKMIAKNRQSNRKTQFFSEEYLATFSDMFDWLNNNDIFYFDEIKYHTSNWQEKRMLLDMESFLPGEILAKVDRASMRYSLECRSPLLDYRIIEFSLGLNHNFKYNKGKGKFILKDIAHDYIPRELLNRPKKGFSIPLDQWMRKYLKEQIIAYTDISYLKKQNLFHPQNTNRIIRDYLKKGNNGSTRNYASICWNFYIFQRWYEEYCKH